MLNVYRIMALVKRGSLNRPLTVSELDGNFEHIIDLISSNVSGATGSQGPSASLDLQQVLNNGRQSNIGINIYSSDYGLHVLSQKDLSENGDYYKSFVLGNNDDFVIALENILGDHYPVIYFNTDVSQGLVKFGVKKVYQNINFWLPTDEITTLLLDNTIPISVNGNYADLSGNIDIGEQFLLDRIYRENPYEFISFNGNFINTDRPIIGTGIKYFLDIDVNPESFSFEQGTLYKENIRDYVYEDTGIKVEPLPVYDGPTLNTKFIWWIQYRNNYIEYNGAGTYSNNMISNSTITQYISMLKDSLFYIEPTSFDPTGPQTFTRDIMFDYVNRKICDMQIKLKNYKYATEPGDSRSITNDSIFDALLNSQPSLTNNNVRPHFCNNMMVFNKLLQKAFKAYYYSEVNDLYSDINNNEYSAYRIGDFFDRISSYISQ